jgi:hypothetical protein
MAPASIALRVAAKSYALPSLRFEFLRASTGFTATDGAERDAAPG